ncbi:GreA/GreB family elongation factor [Cohnella terricola]|uniref:GreA/GreB family elongation factor n=1 Tax=Cohnella terricola TaxID=1289167 RepID=A0A559JFP7_9BACL|nr:GreA/GreB family elongation factor [Cohnella terricola]TVX98698.1 GreA/GreB family elongation factor [Cohnella terricola]
MSRSLTETFREHLLEQLAYFEKMTSELLRKAYPDTAKKEAIQTLISQYCDHVHSFLSGTITGDFDSMAWIGSYVTVVDDMDGSEEKYKLVLPHEIDGDLGHISFLSPLGSRLLLACKGDRIEVDSPSGSYGVLLSDVSYELSA